MNLDDYITTEFPLNHAGPKIKGTQISVHSILEMLGESKTIKGILEEYPEIKSEEAIRAALIWASQNLRTAPILKKPWSAPNKTSLIDDSKLIMDNALSYAYVQSGICYNAQDLYDFQINNKLAPNHWLYYYWKCFSQRTIESENLMNVLRQQYGIAPVEFMWGESLDSNVPMASIQEKLIIPLKVIQQAVIDKCNWFVNEEVEEEIRQQEVDENNNRWEDENYENSTPNRNRYYNENLDMDQQSQEFWDDLESQDFGEDSES